MTMLAQVETVIDVVDRASHADDRWLFLAALAIIIIGGSLCIRWLVSSLQKKDVEHQTAIGAMRIAHTEERAEWRIIMQKTKEEFLAALEKQQAGFREELSNERHQCAQERILDREARHTMANALNNVGMVIQDIKDTAPKGRKSDP